MAVLAATVTVKDPDLPPADAVMIAVPAFSPLMSPDDETPATVGALLDHVTVVLSFAPLGSRTVAVACSVCPTVTLALGAVTVTLATVGAVTTSVALDVMPSTVPEMDTVPAPTAVTAPRLDTVAIEVFELFHVTVRPVMMFPDASVAVAVACVVPPTRMLDEPSTTLTLATVAVDTVSVIEPDTPSTVAVTFDVPTLAPVITPALDTVATLGALLDQVTVRPVIALPDESVAVATACVL